MIIITALKPRAQVNLKWSPLVVSSSVNQSLDSVYKTLSEENRKGYFDGMMGILVFRSLDGKDIGQPIPGGAGIGFPCACMSQKDTFSVGGGIGWEGAFGYFAKASENSFATFFLKGTKEKELKEAPDSSWKDEIRVPSVNQQMVLSKRNPKPGDTVTGMFSLDTQTYFEKEGNEIKEQRQKISFYFKCKVEKYFPF